MTTELDLIAVLDQFVEDLDEGVTPRIYELMASDSETIADLIPLLELITLTEASTVQMPVAETEKVRARVLQVAQTNLDSSG